MTSIILQKDKSLSIKAAVILEDGCPDLTNFTDILMCLV